MISGHVDWLEQSGIGGWVWDTEAPEKRFDLEILDGDDVIAQVTADNLRADLAQAGVGDGRYGFSLAFPPDLLPRTAHRISVIIAGSQQHLRNSPQILYTAHGGKFESFSDWFSRRIDDIAKAAIEPSELAPYFALCTNALSKLLDTEHRLLEQRLIGGDGNGAQRNMPARLKFVLERAMERFRPLQVPRFRAPGLSIIIAAEAGLTETYGLLHSLLQSEGMTDYEIILVDGAGGTDLVVLPFLIKGGGIRIVRTASRVSDFEAFAQAVPMAQGEDLIFLGGALGVATPTIKALRETLHLTEGNAIVGARLVTSDGRIVEAGSRLEALGVRMPLGRYDGKEVPRHRVLKDTADVSPRAFAIKRKLLNAMGGFDGMRAMGPLGMTDLCLRLAEAGHRVLIQGCADIVVGEKSETAPAEGLERMHFVRRWRHRLPAASGLTPRPQPRRALVIDEIWPDPSRDAASVAIVSHCESLMRLGYQVEFVALRAGGELEGYPLFLRGIIPVLGQENVKDLLASREDQFELVYLHRFGAAKDVQAALRASQPRARIVFNIADLHFLRLQRQGRIEKSKEIEAQAKAVEETEKACMVAADAIITHSSEEQMRIRRMLPGKTVCRVLWHQPVASRPVAPWETRQDCLFLGSYRHAPNIDAVTYFCNALWPQIRSGLPDARFEVAGAYIENAGFGALDTSVLLRGFVSETASYLAQKRLMVAPLRFGAGVKGKILLALSQGLPCIMTKTGAEGMDLPPALAKMLVAEDGRDFIAKTIQLYRERPLWEEASELGMAFAVDMLSRDAIDRQIATALAPSSAGEVGIGKV
ncbi:MAG: glycosyltransferase [Proteobacteria bacterium]|nr:glycosyltransferase [Pseudomonadota bacterium]